MAGPFILKDGIILAMATFAILLPPLGINFTRRRLQQLRVVLRTGSSLRFLDRCLVSPTTDLFLPRGVRTHVLLLRFPDALQGDHALWDRNLFSLFGTRIEL